MLPVGTTENVEPALALCRQLEEGLQRDGGASNGFLAEGVDDDPAAL